MERGTSEEMPPVIPFSMGRVFKLCYFFSAGGGCKTDMALPVVGGALAAGLIPLGEGGAAYPSRIWTGTAGTAAFGAA